MTIQHTLPTTAIYPDAWRDDGRQARDFAARCWVSAMRRIHEDPVRVSNRNTVSE